VRIRPVLFVVAAAAASAACKREARPLRVEPPQANRVQAVTTTDLHPGGTAPPARVPSDYDENAYALNQGKQLFSQMNCVGCHAHGGGGMGPALMDSVWIYGSAPEQIFATIVEGRPNGMPAFRGRLTDNQVWQLAAYVRSLSGLAAWTAAPGRADQMYPGKPENSQVRAPLPRQSP
jgi:cytochrome c oxidase cbb3-type subunit 3